MYLIQDVQILMNSWMIHALKLENLNQILQHHVNNISHSHRVRYYSALWYGFDPNRFIIVGNGPKNAIRDGVQGSNINYRTTDFMLVTE